MQKQVIIVHGCPSNTEKTMSPKTRTYDKHWIPWLKRELIAQNIATQNPHMPTPWEPDYEKFKTEFEKCDIDENTILVGHSCGCAFIVQWLGQSKKKIAKLILVAPWKIPEKKDEHRKKFYDYPIDESIGSRVDKTIIFTADDEDDDGKKSVTIFHNSLGGEIINLPGRGHYTLDDMGTEQFPELLKILLE